MRVKLGPTLAAGGGGGQRHPRRYRGPGSPSGGMGAGVGWVALSPHELQHGEDLAAVLGVMVSVCSITPQPSPQAYVNRFKFQSITADDTLGFFLEYFPELKEKGVDSIPGQHGTFLHVGLWVFLELLPLLLPALALTEAAQCWPARDQALTWAQAHVCSA